jgi:hypothetical protein
MWIHIFLIISFLNVNYWVSPMLRNRHIFIFLFFFSFFGRTRVWNQDSYLQSRHSTAWSIPPVQFALVTLEMGSRELFAQAGFEPQSSQSVSQVAKVTDVSHWCLALLFFLILISFPIYLTLDFRFRCYIFPVSLLMNNFKHSEKLDIYI